MKIIWKNQEKRDERNIEQVKQDAAKELARIAQACRKRRRRRLLVKGLGYAVFFACCFVCATCYYYKVDEQLPSSIYLRTGMEETFSFQIPATGAIVETGSSGKSNIPREKIAINLNRPVVLKGDQTQDYQMQVKLFGFLPFKDVRIHVVEEQTLIPVGMPIGLYVKTDGVMVIGIGDVERANGKTASPAKNILKSGDYIKKINDREISEKRELVQAVNQCAGERVRLTIERGDEEFDVEIQPVQDRDSYKLGVWVRDNTQGVGTMTFVDAQGNFGALGHGINDTDTSMIMDVSGGTLYETQIIAIKRGIEGTPGELTGKIVYSREHILGQITDNSPRGIFGKCNQKAMSEITGKPIPIGLKQEIRKDKAQILCTVKDRPELYDVMISDIHINHDSINRGIEMTVCDPRLLELTGGIVQGMFTR